MSMEKPRSDAVHAGDLLAHRLGQQRGFELEAQPADQHFEHVAVAVLVVGREVVGQFLLADDASPFAHEDSSRRYSKVVSSTGTPPRRALCTEKSIAMAPSVSTSEVAFSERLSKALMRACNSDQRHRAEPHDPRQPGRNRQEEPKR